MSIRTAIEIILEEYPKASQQTFRDNPAAHFLREEFPNEVRRLIANDKRYRIKGSAGQGVWVKIPWLAIMDISVTNSPQKGYYIVYLFKEDFSGVYLSLNQGVTTVRQQYGMKAKHALQARARDFKARLGSQVTAPFSGTLNLGLTTGSALGRHYEYGDVCSKFYGRNELPTDETFRADLEQLLLAYRGLTTSQLNFLDGSIEDDEVGFGIEQLIELRSHKRLERNKTLTKKAKLRHGYVCQACGFDFEKVYGAIGRKFIEAHHLVQLSSLKGTIVRLDAKKDFCVLCSNCHRMIHKTLFTGDLKAFQREHLKTLLF